MPSPFSLTLRSVEADRGRALPVLAVAGVLLLGWGAWFGLARVTLFETTRSARLEVDAAARALVSASSGRVLVVYASQDGLVSEGDPILEIEAEPLRIREDEALARRLSLVERTGATSAALEAEQAAAEAAERATKKALERAEAEAAEAESAARQARAEAERAARLLSTQSLSPGEAERLTSAAEQAEARAAAARAQAQAVAAELNRDRSDRQVRVEALRGELAELDASAAEADATLSDLEYRLDRTILRAPVSGRIIELAALKPGDQVREGVHLGSVLPEGEIRAVAHFPPHQALGRIAPGQEAELRLDAFPWAQYGSIPARVGSVAGEARFGQIRVELALDPERVPSGVALQHGLVGTAQVAVERVSPAELVLRAVGRRLDLGG